MTEIYSAAHGNNRVIAGSGCRPIIAGAALTDNVVPYGYISDGTGMNISIKNSFFCELTALYWIWKNTDTDNAGLCHYRRYFASLVNRGCFMSRKEAEHLLAYYDVILPKARNYLIETNYSQYANAHNAADLDLTREIICESYPEYLSAFDRRMNMTAGHRFNMFIMRKSLMDEYCEWLFDILFELEKRLDITDQSERDKRVFGFISERLLDVWADANELRTVDAPYLFIGNEHIIKKAVCLAIRKLAGGKFRKLRGQR